MSKLIAVILILLIVCAGCAKTQDQQGETAEVTQISTYTPDAWEGEEPTPPADYLPELTAANETPTGWTLTPAPTPTPKPWTADDVEAMAQTLAGECYDNKPTDKRLVCEVILNRVSNGYWGDTVIAVITYPKQFYGYYTQHRAVTENDREIAEETLADWYAGGCEPLSEYLYFESGPNHENVFRAKY